MFQNNPLLAQLKQQLHGQIPRVEGIVKGTEKGFGFLEVDSQSYFIPPPHMKKVMHGDRIIAILTKDKQREIAEPEVLVEPFLKRFIGRIEKKSHTHRQLSVMPDHPLLKNAIPIGTTLETAENLQSGDWVVAQMCHHPLKDSRGFFAEISEVITTTDDHFAPWKVTLSRHQLEKQAPQAHRITMLDEQSERSDLTALPFMTIDGTTTEDMDDALYVRDNGNDTLTLYIAIADPTAYIAENDATDLMARQRGFTNYLPGFTIPMLPHELADNLCSLQPMQRRPALVCSVTVQTDGTLSDDIVFSSAWIESKAKLAYNDVSDWLEQQGKWQPENEQIAKQLRLLQQVAERRHAWRQQHSLVFPDISDYRFIFDDNRNVEQIVVEQRRCANQIVEEAMITANLCAAVTLRDRLGYGIFNVHTGFDPNLIDQAINTLKTNTIEFQAEQLLTLEGFRQLRRTLSTQPTQYIDSRIRRYQNFAEITTVPGPHFGLGFDVYATWTSPIRKYGDMVNQRLLKALLTDQPTVEPEKEIVQQLMDRRRLNRIAERDVTEWLYARYLQDKADGVTQYLAEIIDVFRGGMRVRLLNIGAIAFIPASFIHAVRDELLCNQENGTVQINGNVAYRQNDCLTVVISEVRMETRSVIAKPLG